MPRVDPDRDKYPDRALFTSLIGNSAKSRVLTVMLKEAHRDLDAKEIAELANVHQSTVYEPLEELEELGVVIETRTVGKSRMFQLNRDSKVAKKLKQTEEALIDEARPA